MNNIKSENAKKWLRLSVTHRDSPIGKEHDNFIPQSDVIRAVELAEQDAEERAVEIVKDFIAEGLFLTKEDDIVCKFKESLNGGQSDE